MDLHEEVKAVLDSGIEPITMVHNTVYSCLDREPVALRARLEINSLDIGTLTDDEYQVTADRTKRAILLCGRAMEYAKRALSERATGKKAVSWISVKCPDTFLSKTNPVKAVKTVFADAPALIERLCLEFSPRVFYNRDEQVLPNFEALKKLGVKTVLSDFGDEYCPAMKLMEFPFDYVILHKDLAKLLCDRERDRVTAPLLSYVKGLRVGVYAPLLGLEHEMEAYSRAGCNGYLDLDKKARLLKKPEVWWV